PFFGFSKTGWESDKEAILSRVKDEIGFPCFVKSSSLGSSVGVSKVDSPRAVSDAVEASLGFSERVIIERAVLNLREVEVSVMGNQDPKACKEVFMITKKSTATNPLNCASPVTLIKRFRMKSKP
ncbi:ATP-grasp domain-containing protein, partial [Candidatus Poribacteria bacterium]|nr:ATP-grasp domain-containing protein [Candidatus Poribacteria bacterium]